MSMTLGLGTVPEDLYTKVYDHGVIVGDYSISYLDFYHLIVYFMTNTNLKKMMFV